MEEIGETGRGYTYIIHPIPVDTRASEKELMAQEERRVSQAGAWAQRKVLDILGRVNHRKTFRLTIEETYE